MGKSFVLLKDFHHSYSSFPLKPSTPEDEFEESIRSPMIEALQNAVNQLSELELGGIRNRTQEVAKEGYYVATLDGGSYFSSFDFSFEITRACYALSGAATGPHIRLARSVGHLISQGLRMLQHYNRQHVGKPIALCDDGVDTGHSLRQIVQTLRQLNLEINKIIVLMNPHRLEHVNAIDVETLIDIEHDFAWLSERDLYWGLPRSGLSYTHPYELHPAFGVPYTIDAGMVEARIGIRGDAAKQFRSENLRINQRFWEHLEYHHHRELFLEDCQRLSFLVDLVARPQTRVVDFLNEINHSDFRL